MDAADSGSRLQNLGTRTLLLSTSQGVARFISFIWILYLSRYFGPDLYGRYVTVMSYVGVLLPFCDFGMGIAVIRDIAQDHSKGPSSLGSQFWMRLALGSFCALSVMGAGFLPQYSASHRILFFLGGIHLLVNTLGLLGEVVFVAYERQGYLALTTFSFTAGWAFWGTLFLRWTGDLRYVFVAMVWNTLLTACLQWFLVRRYFFKPDWSLRPAIWKYQLQEGYPIGLTGLLTTAPERLDRILLSFFRTESAVGHYGAANLLTGPLLDVVWNPLLAILLPVLSRGHHAGGIDIKWITRKVLLWGLSLALPLVIVGSFFAMRVIPLLFGNRYLPAGPLFAVSLWTLPFMLLNRYLLTLYISGRRQRLFLRLSILTFGFNLVMNLYLIPRIGAIGAALTAVATQALMSVLAFRALKDEMHSVWDPGSILRLIATAGAGALPLYFHPSMGLKTATALSAATFAALTYTWVFTSEDRQLIARWIGRRSTR